MQSEDAFCVCLCAREKPFFCLVCCPVTGMFWWSVPLLCGWYKKYHSDNYEKVIFFPPLPGCFQLCRIFLTRWQMFLFPQVLLQCHAQGADRRTGDPVQGILGGSPVPMVPPHLMALSVAVLGFSLSLMAGEVLFAAGEVFRETNTKCSNWQEENLGVCPGCLLLLCFVLQSHQRSSL